MSSSQAEKKWALSKYAVWENNFWKEVGIDKPNTYLIMINSQLIIISRDTALESLCLLGVCGKIEALFANANIEIKVTDKFNKASKFRIQLADGFKNKSDMENCLEVLEELQKFVKITQHTSHRGKTPKKLIEKNYPEVAKEIIKEKRFNFKHAVDSIMKESFTKRDAQLFLLNPQSSALVNKVQSFLPKPSHKKNHFENSENK